MIELSPLERAIEDATTDALVVTATEATLSPAAQTLDGLLDGAISAAREAGELRGKFAERIVMHTLGRVPARLVLILGLGKLDRLDAFRVVNAHHFAAERLRELGARSAALAVDPAVVSELRVSTGDAGAALRAAATGIALGNVDRQRRRSTPPTKPELERVEVAVDGAAADAGDLRWAATVAAAVDRARALAVEPANLLTPQLLAERARELCQGTKLEIEVLQREALEDRGMGALLGVGQGSAHPPVLITVRHRGGGGKGGPVLALVGKGITFDTGGISLKPAANMEDMKFDMGGAAAVLVALRAIAELELPIDVIGVVPSAENMPSSTATKPGDVHTSLSGKTIEVINTDAEGRLILADGLEWARRQGATHLVDAATLTGACKVALGHACGGLMTNNRPLGAAVLDAARRAGDRFAELPMHPEYDVCLESDVADLKNVGSRPGAAINAAIFLREFAGDLPWVHLDIAGTAWNPGGDQKQIPRGPSGAPVRTLVALAAAMAQEASA
ncbi:MAG: leucyl aminopeptidase [Candidatus Dormibacteria bacterium]